MEELDRLRQRWGVGRRNRRWRRFRQRGTGTRDEETFREKGSRGSSVGSSGGSGEGITTSFEMKEFNDFREGELIKFFDYREQE